MSIDIGLILTSLSYKGNTSPLKDRRPIEDLNIDQQYLDVLQELGEQMYNEDLPQSDHKCPECGRYFSLVTINGVHVDTCRFCRSIWFDTGELSAITNLASDVLSETLRDRPSRFMCPVCGKQMKEYVFKAPANILVDQCVGRHGVYLESGELIRIFKTL